ncbi:sporulation integral membrane protein YtvI [Thalassobacillus hwangdonensis]|uniref:Sporulation integral membrane protein YtvI n=1 Tax=Thalassobacillus hwangdonensis TaxID=546108 RepID=A0ABW3L0X6_9BACI
MDLTMVYRTMRLLLVAAAIFGGLFIVYFAAQYTYPFIIALIIAFFINPVVDMLEERVNMPRGLAVFLAILAILALIAGIITLLVVELANGASYLADEVPEHFKSLVNYIQVLISSTIVPFYERILSILSNLEPSQQQTIMDHVQNVGENIAQEGALVLQEILQKIPVLLKGLPNYVTILVFSLLGTFFISKDWYRLGDKVKSIAPQRILTSSMNILQGLKQALFGFVKAQLTLISITAVIVLIGLLVLRVDYAVTIAIITGAVDLMPYLGTGLIFVPWIIYMFFTGNYFLSIGLSVLYIIVVVQRQVMEPKVLSTNIGVDPLATLIALFVGFQLLGFLGLIVGPVTLVILNTIHRTGVAKEVWNYILQPDRK